MQPVPSSSRPFLRVPRRIQIGLFWCTIAVPTACAHGVESDLVLLEDAAAPSTGQTTGSLAGGGGHAEAGPGSPTGGGGGGSGAATGVVGEGGGAGAGSGSGGGARAGSA